MYGLSNGITKFDLSWPLKVKGQGQANPEKFEVKYLKNGTR